MRDQGSEVTGYRTISMGEENTALLSCGSQHLIVREATQTSPLAGCRCQLAIYPGFLTQSCQHNTAIKIGISLEAYRPPSSPELSTFYRLYRSLRRADGDAWRSLRGQPFLGLIAGYAGGRELPKDLRFERYTLRCVRGFLAHNDSDPLHDPAVVVHFA